MPEPCAVSIASLISAGALLVQAGKLALSAYEHGKPALRSMLSSFKRSKPPVADASQSERPGQSN